MRRQHQGFTLVELLVVLVIISVVVGSGVFLSLGMLSQRRVQQAAYRIQRVVNGAQLQAVLQGRVLGLCIRSNGYRWVSLNAKGKWLAVPSSVLVPGHFSGVRVRVLDARPETSSGPDVAFLDDFTMSHFVIEVMGLSSPYTKAYVVGDGAEPAVVRTQVTDQVTDKAEL